MYCDDGTVCIKRLSNGYTISLRDPKIVAANRKLDRMGKPSGSYRDPQREFVFDDIAKVTAWLNANLDKALPKEDFETAFDMAAAEDEGDDD